MKSPKRRKKKSIMPPVGVNTYEALAAEMQSNCTTELSNVFHSLNEAMDDFKIKDEDRAGIGDVVYRFALTVMENDGIVLDMSVHEKEEDIQFVHFIADIYELYMHILEKKLENV